MRVAEARAIARTWVHARIGNDLPISGAFLHGSIDYLFDSDLISPESDVDILVIPEPGAEVVTRAKMEANGILLDVSPIDAAQIADAESVLGAYHLAGSLRSASSILYDATGHLGEVQQLVAREFAKPERVRQRVDDVISRIEQNLAALESARSREDRLISWLFAAGVTTHALLVAGLRNPTVRNRYPALRTMLADLNHPEYYSPLIDLLDPMHAEASDVVRYIDQLEPFYDLALARQRTWFHFSEDLSIAGRIGAIDSSRKLVAAGQSRDALFWLGVTATRCMMVLNADGTAADRAEHDQFLDELAVHFGVDSSGNASIRSSVLRDYLSTLVRHSDLIIDQREQQNRADWTRF